MFDSHKIDAFFNGDKPFENDKTENKPKRSVWLRFIKLGFPCFAAAILGVMLVMPNIKKSIDLKDDITIPRKNELESLHMEQTVFSTTDSQNRVASILADSLDEVSAGSKEVKFNAPKGNIPTDSGDIKISSEIGFFNQETNIVRLQKNVKAVSADNTVVNTSEANYEFEKDYGYGNQKVSITGDFGTINAEGFEYFKNDNILVLKGYNVINHNNDKMSAEKESRLFQNENKIVSVGNVVMHQKNNIMNADKVISYFNASSQKALEKMEATGNVIMHQNNNIMNANKVVGYFNSSVRNTLEKVEATGNVVIHQDKNIMHADKVISYFKKNANNELEKIESFGKVRVITPKGTAKGDKGIYNPLTSKVELLGNVIIEQNGNFIKGYKAETDLKTSVSHIIGNKQKGERISGTFFNKRKTAK